MQYLEIVEGKVLDTLSSPLINSGSASVKQATLNLLQQYRSLGDDVTNFNLALRDLALQIKLFDTAVQKVRIIIFSFEDLSHI